MLMSLVKNRLYWYAIVKMINSFLKHVVAGTGVLLGTLKCLDSVRRNYDISVSLSIARRRRSAFYSIILGNMFELNYS